MTASYEPDLIATLREAGITEYEVDRSRPHHRLLFEANGRKVIFVYPASPSDSRRGLVNALTDLRRIIGVKRSAKRSDRPPRKRNRTRPEPVLTFPVRADPWEKLRAFHDAAQIGRSNGRE